MHHIRWSVEVSDHGRDLKKIQLSTKGWADGEPRFFQIWTKDGFTVYKRIVDVISIVNPEYSLWENFHAAFDSWAKVEWDARGLL